MTWVVVAGVVVAVTAAVRSTWSPCGASMLSSITPLGERSRGHRYPVTISWFLAGTLAGGATLGSFAAAGAWAMRSVSPEPASIAALVGLAALAAFASDLGIGGFRLPANPRQVNRSWLDEYRPWVYAVGFGWQLGVGVATYVMTGAVYLVVVAAAATADPLVAAAVASLFGVVRGVAILPASRIRHPAELVRLHEGFERLRPSSRVVALIGIVAVAVLAAGASWGSVVASLTALLLAGVAWVFRAGLRDPLPDPDATSTRVLLDPKRAPA
jgi:hypothetical protein